MKAKTSPSMFVFLALLLACSPALAAPEGVAELNDPEYTTRVVATERLLADDTLTLDQIEAWGRQVQSPEQGHRLLAVAQHHTLRLQRIDQFPQEGPGSIGIVQSIQAVPNADGQGQRPVAIVTRVLPGFPAMGRLRAQDVIVGLNGDPLRGAASRELFAMLMRPYKAGEAVTLNVQRGDEVLDIELVLASSAALPQMYSPPNFNLTDGYAALWRVTRTERFAGLTVTATQTPPPDQTEQPAGDAESIPINR